jgi:hypothetical protein
MKTELDKMVADQIIGPVLVVPKKHGSTRICLDPRDLNAAIKCSHYPLLMVEDVATCLTNAKLFSVLDAKCGFWQVKLGEKFSYYTTFNTPFGRFRWLRMPFRISSAPKIEGLQGAEVIADDFLVGQRNTSKFK